ncbi:MAG: hypothetical protein AB7W59_06745 [Acidimicrobiia bacterium]
MAGPTPDTQAGRPPSELVAELEQLVAALERVIDLLEPFEPWNVKRAQAGPDQSWRQRLLAARAQLSVLL